MMNQQYDEEKAKERRRQKFAEAKRIKKRQKMIRKLIRKIGIPAAGIGIAISLIFTVKSIVNHSKTEQEISTEQATIQSTEASSQLETELSSDHYQEVAGEGQTGEVTEETKVNAQKKYTVQSTDSTQQVSGDIISNYALIIDAQTGDIIAQKNAQTRINPASMTKILTILVAAENLKSLEDTVTITREVIDYSYSNDCSNVGFEENEVVSVEDLFYGTVLSSGGEAAAALAIYTAGSLDAFVDMMNDKIEELGIAETAHVTNCVGLYDENHYCTLEDMAIMLSAAIDNELCKEVLSAHIYKTSLTTQHPEGVEISNWFLRRIEDKDTSGTVVCGKTGYVVQSGNCAASYAEDADKRGYICVTADANSGWRCIYDHVALYKQFL